MVEGRMLSDLGMTTNSYKNAVIPETIVSKNISVSPLPEFSQPHIDRVYGVTQVTEPFPI